MPLVSQACERLGGRHHPLAGLSTPPGSKLFATTCPLCQAVIGASVLLDPRKDRAIASLQAPKAGRALNRA